MTFTGNLRWVKSSDFDKPGTQLGVSFFLPGVYYQCIPGTSRGLNESQLQEPSLLGSRMHNWYGGMHTRHQKCAPGRNFVPR
eukprot:3037988-Rhodomonas_salina.3